MDLSILVIQGDGIGTEIIPQAQQVLRVVGRRFGHTFSFEEYEAGGAALDHTGAALPEETLAACLTAHTVLFGPVGGPKWDPLPPTERPEQALLTLRGKMDLYADLRPIRMFPQLSHASPLLPQFAAGGIDLVLVRELTGGIYYGSHDIRLHNGQSVASDIMSYTERQVERVARTAFEMARKRRGKVVSVDKSDVLSCSRLWKNVVCRVAQEYPSVQLNHMLADSIAMQLMRNPWQFDVVLTENMLGDVLSGEAAMLTGSIGMIPFASLGNSTEGIFGPIHGTAPDIAGQNIANPLAAILSAAMLLRHSFGLQEEADAVEKAVNRVLDDGYRTVDILSAGCVPVSCSKMGELVAGAVLSPQIYRKIARGLPAPATASGKGRSTQRTGRGRRQKEKEE
ncbi:MAG: 3-isopropylmalate dehydrogenase [Pygmaiobacter massiliensis]|nr:3-isopropylmalate dehydrogenase [Pygmaiobacter massiliensis]